jgi:hypothetical protein
VGSELHPTASESRRSCSELHRLRAVFLTAISADETQIEASLREAIRTANLESFGIFALKLPEFGIGSPFRSGAGKLSIVVVDLKNTLNRTASHSYPLSNRSDIVIEHQTLRGLRATVNLSQMDAAPLSLPMFLVFGSSGRERRKLGVHAKAR